MSENKVKKTALITGINGMDGSHMADFLLEKGYKIFGMSRDLKNPYKNIQHIKEA